METDSHRTTIQNFYAGQSVLITGGTGFLGKILIEKLLRSCSDISTLYLLIRPKKDQSFESRLDEMFKIPLYDRLKKEVPNFHKKIVPIIGDLNVESFGLSENDKKILINKVSIIFHMAANVNFDEKINISTVVNVNAVDTIIKLAKLMPKLKSLIHVSTAYANCHMDHIEERFYTYSIDHKDLITFIRTIPENVIKEKLAKITSQWPNVYTFTKAIAEGLVRDKSQDLPIGIFRPTIISSNANEPLVGWIDNMYGSIGFAVFFLLGITRFQRCNADLKANLVPADFTVNALIASAWDIFNQCRRGKDMLIYNFVSPGVTWRDYTNEILAINKIYPLHNARWLPLMTYTRYKILHKVYTWLGHLLPALIMDAVSICTNRNPRMWKLYMKIHKFCKAIEPFCNKEWSFSNDNIEAMWDHLSEKDQQLFKFSMKEFDWTNYFINQYKGIRLYLLKDDDSTVEISRIKYKRFYWIHQTMKAIFIFVVLWILWVIFTKIFA